MRADTARILKIDRERAGGQPPAQLFEEKVVPFKGTKEEVIARIEALIANPPRQALPFWISPAVAAYILPKYNIGNRTKKPGKISQYADDMSAGKWADTRESIKFSDKLLLRDGQNRLYAIMKSGVEVVLDISFGVEDAAFLKMDQGKSRSGGDLLQIAGYRNTTHLASAIRWVHLIETGRVRNRDTFEPSEIVELVQQKYPDLPDFMVSAGRITIVTGQPKGLVAALLRQFTKANAEKAKEWTAAWEIGKDAGAYKPLALVTKRIAEIKTASQGPVQDHVRAALLVQAWNLFVEGRKGVKDDIGWTSDQEFPAIKG